MSNRPTQLRRRGLLQAAIAAGVFGASTVPINAAPKKGGLLRAAFSKDVLNCAIRNGSVFESLTRISPDGLLNAGLAVSWQPNFDATRWKIELRRDVVFHNRHAFGAADVVSSLIDALGKTDDLKLSVIKRISTGGRYQIDIELRVGNPDLPYLLAHPDLAIRPKASILAQRNDYVGTGLYRIEDTTDGIFRARRVQSHYRDGVAGWFDEFEIHRIENQSARQMALLERQVDVINLTQNPVGLENIPNRRAEVISINGIPKLAKNSRLTGEQHIGDGWACHNICIPTQWSMA